MMKVCSFLLSCAMILAWHAPAIAKSAKKPAKPGQSKRILVSRDRNGIVCIAVKGGHRLRFDPVLIQKGDRSELIVNVYGARAKTPVASYAINAAAPSVKTATPASMIATPSLTPTPFSPLPPVKNATQSVVVVSKAALSSPSRKAVEFPTGIEVAYGLASLDEDYSRGDSRTMVEGVPFWQAAYCPPESPVWRPSLSLERWQAYLVEDELLPGSWHSRTTTGVEAALRHRNELLGLSGELSVGYFLRAVQVENRFIAPAPSFLFSEYQFFHGPSLVQSFVLPLGWGCRLTGELSLSPLVMSRLEPEVSSIGLLYGGGERLGIESRIGPFKASLASQVRVLRRFDGPFQQISGIFLGFGL